MKKLTILFAAVLFTLYIVQSTSYNAFAQWQQVGLNSSNVLSIATDSTNIFAATDYGIYLSTDYGNSWTYKGLLGLGAASIVIDGTNIFAGGFGVYLSTDTGNTWSNIGLSNDTLTSLAVSGTNIFAGANNYYTGSGGVFLSTDTSGLWTPVNNGLYDPSVTSLLINGNNIFAGTINGGVFLSIDTGSNWNQVNNGLTNFWIFSIASYGNNIFVGADSRVFLSTNNGNLWTPTDPIILAVWDFDTSGTNIFAGTTNGVFLSTNGGNLWTAVNNNGFLFPYTIRSIAIKGNYIYAGTEGGYGIWRRPLSEILGIKENYNNINMLCPNPTNGKFKITQTNNIKTIEVLNVFGEQIYYSNPAHFKSTIEVDLSSVPKGIYFVKVNNGVNTQTEKIVVQ